MSLHSDTLFCFRANQSLLLLLNPTKRVDLVQSCDIAALSFKVPAMTNTREKERQVTFCRHGDG